jgi:nitroimidazol reductase NimA-like FMN-containing flavoprotein (pyridoxamine 5'-phosphate oxidase superfamily)
MSGEDLQKLMSAVSLSKEEIEIWYYYDGTNLIVPTMKGSKKARNIQKNPHVSLVIDTVEGKPEDISYLNAKAVIVNGKSDELSLLPR